MRQITENQYKLACSRVEELLPLFGYDTPGDESLAL